jgi:hypothetical protein
MSKQRKTWVYSPPKPPSPKVPATVKARVEQRANEFVETELKPRFIEPPPKIALFNYVVDIYTRWYRHYFHFCATYACPSPNAISPFFETKFARLEYLGGQDNFSIAYMRHTGQWWEVYSDQSLEQCLAIIRLETLFQP